MATATATSTKTARTLQASTSVSAGGSQTSSTWDGRTCRGGTITARVTNGGTGPTVGCTVSVNISTDGTTWRQMQAVVAGVAASTPYDFIFILSKDVMYAQVTFSGHTGQAITAESYLHEFSSDLITY